MDFRLHVEYEYKTVEIISSDEELGDNLQEYGDEGFRLCQVLNKTRKYSNGYITWTILLEKIHLPHQSSSRPLRYYGGGVYV